MTVTLRRLRWPDDREDLMALDTSFSTSRIYRVEGTGFGIELVEQAVDGPICKTYPWEQEVDDLHAFDFVAVAESEGAVVGVAAVELQAWNRRAALQRLYVAPGFRGEGIGRVLVEDAIRAARTLGARCLWVETQNINFPAIQFYRRLGFRFCGLDLTLYDPSGPGAGETAVYFARDLDDAPSG